jgi:lysophospholipase L1-like esterase
MNDSFKLTPELDAALNAFVSAFAAVARKQRLESFAVLNRFADKNATVLLGDSITEGFPIQEMYRGPSPIYNRSIAGDTSRDVLNRLQASVYALQPARVFLLIGTNDIELEQGHPLEETAERIEEICLLIRGKLPQTRLFLLSIFPVHATDHPKIEMSMVRSRTNETIQALNALLRQIANRLEIPYIDVYSHLTGPDGNLRVDYTFDGIHLTAEGYCVVFSILKEYLEA